jgi:aminoglycoside phosphotransferase (APT) family kinase protein
MHAFEGGQSNPTFRITARSGDYVLRRKPIGQLLPSAHAVDREFRVLRALYHTPVPVPRVHALCEGDAVLGSAFYVMDFVPGRILRDPRLPDLSPAERSAVFDSMGEMVARLHAVDPNAIGLCDFGRPDNYLQRQVTRWSRQYLASETDPIPAMHHLMEWLPSRLPPSGPACIVHGDLRLDNMLIHPTEPKVMAVLDWELSTLGDPLVDFSYSAMVWRLAPGLFRGLEGVELGSLGIPTEADYRAAYERRTGRTIPAGWDVYIVFNMFRLAAILQGIAKRALDGTAANRDAVAAGERARPVAEKAWRLAETIEWGSAPNPGGGQPSSAHLN